MKRIILFMIVLFACFPCISPSQARPINDTIKLKAWLIDVVESYLNPKDLKAAYAKMKSSLTSNYYNYKQDAIDLEYDHPGPQLTPELFNKKWKSRYNTKFVGIGGFFIPEQDPGTVKVTSCVFIKHTDQNSYLFKVVIEDQTFKQKFNRDIKVVKNGSSFLIDDIIEYN